jgi:hypothetical protein
VVVVYWRFGTTYRSNLQASRSHEVQVLSSWTSWSLKIGPIGCPKTSAEDYHSTLRNILEERRSDFTLL